MPNKSTSFNEFAFLDVETTGFNAGPDRVIEVAVLKIKNNQIVEEFESLVNPGFRPSREIRKITGIQLKDLLKAPSFEQIAVKLRSLLKNSVFVAHNVEFDYGFITNEFLTLKEPFTAPRLCTVKLSQTIYPQYARHNLDSIASRHNISIGSRHRALDDTKAIWEFFNISKNYYGEQNFDAALAKLIKPAKVLRQNNKAATPAALGSSGSQLLDLFS